MPLRWRWPVSVALRCNCSSLALWPTAAYAALLALAGLAFALAWANARTRDVALAIGIACALFAGAGLRADQRLADALPSALEGQDIVVTGVVAELPRQMPDGVRFTFEVEAALHDGRPVAVPRRISLGWYRGWDGDALIAAPFEALRAGQRWRFTVRLKAPHGVLNPHGFDLELWLFEQTSLGRTRCGHFRPEETRFRPGDPGTWLECDDRY